MNKNMKTMFLFTTLLILLIGVGCATAADITDDSTTDTIEQTSTTEPVNVDNNAINKASNSKSITKTANSTEASTTTATDVTITESTYSTYFDSSSVAKNSAFANTKNVKLSGDFKNKDFIFDNVKLTVTGDGTLYNTSVVSQNNAQITFDKLNINNTNKNTYAVLLESAGNTISNSYIYIVDNKPLHGIEVTGSNNTLNKVYVDVTAPSADVEYDANFVGHPQTSSILIASDNNKIEDSTVYYMESEKTGYYPSIDGIDIQSPSADVVIKNNVISNTLVYANGSDYVYAINVGRAKDTKIEKIMAIAQSKYYTNGIQLFDANGITISGNIVSLADSEAYGVYSTAMGVGSSKDITLEDLELTAHAPKATGALMEGSSNILITESDFTIRGNTTTAVDAHVDWMGNIPENVTITHNNFKLNGTADNSVLYFGLSDNVDVNFNKITSTKGSEINFNKTTKGKVTNNTISIAETIVGDAGVITTENDTFVKDNGGIFYLTDDNYSKFFNNESIAKASIVTNNTELVARGNFYNKDFIFDNVKVKFYSEKDSTFFNSSFVSQNKAEVEISNITIDNTNKNTYAVLFESENNLLDNVTIKVVDNKPLHAIEVTGNGNTLQKIKADVKAPSADVDYDANFVGHPQTSAVLLASDNNKLEDSTISFDGSEKTGYYPSADGIDIQSPSANITIKNNIISNVNVTTKGPTYVYGINVGRAKDTTLDNINVKVESDYYSNGVQLFDADGITITGKINSKATTEAYGVYSTAMGMGSSKDIDLTGLDITVNSAKATGALMEGSSNIMIAKAKYDITGDTAFAVDAHVDWMGNVPKNVTVQNMDLNVKGKDDTSVLYFGLCEDVTVTNNNITSTKGSEINFNKTTKGKVTNNYIVIGEDIYGDNAVVSTETDTVVKNNRPHVTIVAFDKIANTAYGDNVTITGKFIDNSGKTLGNTNLKLNINGKTVTVKTGKGGAFTYTTKATKVGTNNVTVSYAGNSKYGKVSNKTTFKVVKQNLTVKINKIANVVYKNNVTIKGTFADANGKGIANTLLKLNINGKTVNVKTGKGGAFTYTTKATKVGTNNVTVSYAGNTNYNKVSAKTTFKVVKQDLKVTLNKISTVKYKEKATITGKLTDAKGNIIKNTILKVKVNSKTYSVKTNANGVFTLKATATATGKNNVTVSYAGNTNYNKVSAKTTFTANKQNVLATLSSVKVNKGKVTVTGKLTDGNKKVLMNSLAKVTINGKATSVKTNNKGVFTYTKSVKSGTVKVTIGYAGNKNYNAYTGQTISVTA